jgi:hypothetical protein
MADIQQQQGDHGPVLTTTEARQGRRGRHVLWVLVISMALLVVGYGVMVAGVQGARLSSPGGQTAIDRKTLQQSGGVNLHAPPQTAPPAR